MNDNRRPIGIFIISIICILEGLFWMSSIRNFANNLNLLGTVFYPAVLLVSAGKLFSGLFVFRLNMLARKATIILCLAGIVIGFAAIETGLRKAEKQVNLSEVYQKKKEWIETNLKLESQQEALDKLKANWEITQNAAPIFVKVTGYLLAGTPILILNLIPIIYLTRPKIKQQFKSN